MAVDSTADFAFSDALSAIQASEVLLAQVFLNVGDPFDTDPQAVGAVAEEPLPQLVVERPRDPELFAGLADVAELFCAPEDLEAESVYAVLEGHCGVSFVPVSQQELRRNASLTLLTFCSEVSRPLRHSSP